MKFKTYEEFIAWLETDPSEELRKQAFMTIPSAWNMRFLREYVK
jgi:hypothetical protein